MISLVTRMIVRSNKVSEFEKFIHDNLEAIIRENPGSFSYTIHRSKRDSLKYFSVQIFKSQEILSAIVSSPHMESAREKYSELFAATPAVEICEVLEEI